MKLENLWMTISQTYTLYDDVILPIHRWLKKRRI
jgi:hypothetical protein